MFDEEISTSEPLLEHSTSILGVWVNHVTIHKIITLYYQNMQLSQAPTKILQAASPGRDLHVSYFVFCYDNTGL